MKYSESISRARRVLFVLGIMTCLFVLTSCGGKKKEAKDFNQAMDQLNQYKGESSPRVTREQAQAELEASRESTKGKEIKTMSMEEFKKLSESQRK